MTKARFSSTKLRKPLINAVRSVNVEPVVECESLESYHVDDVEGTFQYMELQPSNRAVCISFTFAVNVYIDSDVAVQGMVLQPMVVK
ncbi:hypothetical protein DAPPUDRAFT_241032 [Daphnia pulex]|uniref:Uncharacterized protein n=1 Tax=Daphnia pulex TaxID=6669 RepID=E9GD86_DAPPU|nr:hypothetical protein DAPPUDRAFT_241032 [Daphnia pulex]|eukprot:EFX82737.1 hypothetical protein DAPPUDRAFT_241032 [Daphnia pulex]